ncbi:MAG: ABC transporter permease [Chloroflexota bacterium]|nr:ABC transporter permease [Chloroflexota bacterium]
MTVTRRAKPTGLLTALPGILWLGLFFFVPIVVVFGVSFLTRGRGGAGNLPFTFANYARVFDVFSGVILDSIWIALLNTIICLAIGYPLAFWIATRRTNWVRVAAIFMIILPFWTNFLVRTYALQTILAREGLINGALINLGLISEPLQLLNTTGAVLAGLLYGFLPFMVLPIYASVERFDFRYAEAAFDLGANDVSTFWRVVLPMTLPGVVAGVILVFIPTIGAFVTPDLLGGAQGLMIGTLINTQYKGQGNQPLGSALSMVLTGLVMVALLIYVRFGERRED